MVVLWGPQCNPMSPIYIKMSKFLNFLLATSKISCGCLGVRSRGHLGKKYIQNLSETIFAFEIFEIPQKT